jgi:hypothetical protein
MVVLIAVLRMVAEYFAKAEAHISHIDGMKDVKNMNFRMELDTINRPTHIYQIFTLKQI